MLGYYTTDKCTFISNGANNWLRLNDNGTLTWKGDNIAVNNANNALYSKGNDTGNFHLGLEGSNKTGAVFLRSDNGIYCRKASDAGVYVPVLASKFTVSSEEKWKENIEEVSASATNIINGAKVYEYDLRAEENGSRNIGMIIEK